MTVAVTRRGEHACGRRRVAPRWLVAALFCAAPFAVAATGPLDNAKTDDSLPADVFARVGDEVVSTARYEAFLASRLRQRYYHGKIPHGELDTAFNEIVAELVDAVLLEQEARRRGLDVEAVVDQQMKALQQREGEPGAGDAEQRRAQLRGHALRRALEETIKSEVTEPSAEALSHYYEQNPEKFTTPEQWRLSLILLKVPPYAAAEQWQAAQAEAARLHALLTEQQVNFAALAREYSGDDSAAHGGDLGLVHAGMLSPEVQAEVAKLQAGELTPPLLLLQGVAILRLEQRIDAKLNNFESVSERARALLHREQAEDAWRSFVAELRARTPVVLSPLAMER